MRIDIVTGFPNLVKSPLEESILKRAQQKGLVDIHIHDLRDHASGRHRQIDDYPYGGGSGMILKPEPIFRCVEAILQEYPCERRKIILLSPQGQLFNQELANELAQWEHLILICGHYKGVDERVAEYLATDEISIGDYVLSGGELPALVVIDAVVRLIPGVLGDYESAQTDSFQNGLLDHPHYTRPENFRGMRVPEVLLSGNHAAIARWRRERAIQKTRTRRKDLWERYRQKLQSDDEEWR